jgi:2-succinyl-6-hydroxy-2,4-cyclohexadiene-1-carboxylate synthase
MPKVEIRGTSHVYDLTAPATSGVVLVFIHGWLLSRSYWRPLMERLSPQFQCLSYDLRGFGDSCGICEDQEQCYSPAAYAEDLSQLLAQLNIQNAWLVGHSLGGTIALWGAQALPDRIAGVTCVNAGGGVYLEQEFERFRAMGRNLVQWLPLLDWMFAKAGTVQPMASHWRRQRLLDYVGAHSAAARGALLESTTREQVHRLPQVVAQLKQPVYFLSGDRDPIMHPRYVRHLASFHSSFRDSCGDNLIEIRDCGHMAMLEQPEAVAERMRCILAAHPLRVEA